MMIKTGFVIVHPILAYISKYMRLMVEMGYRRVEGYVWYISLGEIVDVAL